MERARIFRRKGIRAIFVVTYLLQCRASALPLSPMSSFGGSDFITSTPFRPIPPFSHQQLPDQHRGRGSYLQALSHDANAQAIERMRSVRHRPRCGLDMPPRAGLKRR